MNIVLIGYRGTGKSEAGRLAAARLGLAYLSLDAEIVAQAGMTVPEIVAASGWPGFRDLESEAAAAAARLDRTVIDTGGGIVERPDNIAVLRNRGVIVWLKASPATIIARIAGDTERPSLTGAKSFTDEVAEVLARRTPLYEKAARFAIDTDGLAVEEVAERIVEIYLSSTRARAQRSGARNRTRNRR